MLRVNIMRTFDVHYTEARTGNSRTYHDVRSVAPRGAAKHVAYTLNLKLSPMLVYTNPRTKAETYGCGQHHRLTVTEVHVDLTRAIDQRRAA